ncbi:MAG: hypothetical protein RRA15_10700 [bacterium]|nr:hypothetical protein [bacterium]
MLWREWEIEDERKNLFTVYFLGDIGQLVSRFGGGVRVASLGSTSFSTSDSGEGGDGGSFTYSGSYSASWDETSYNTSTVQSLSFNDFADSAGAYIYYSERPGGIDLVALSEPRTASLAISDPFALGSLQAGRGSIYRSSSLTITTDGIPYSVPTILPLVDIGPGMTGPVGRPISRSSAYYLNYGDLFIRQGDA